MYRLRDLKNGLWQIHVSNGPAYEGTFSKIYRECVRLGLPHKEIEDAVVELRNNEDDYAEFGVFGTFMFTMRDKKAA